jgi:RND family efflux transporter MFP subunit
MTLKKNSGSVLLKLALILVVLAAVGWFAYQQFQVTARVKPAERGNAVDAVTGTVLVLADKGIRPVRAEAGGKVVECGALDPNKHFKKGDVLVKLDSTELERNLKDTRRRYESDKERAHFMLTGGKPELLAKAGTLSDEARVQLLLDNNPNRKVAFEKLTNARRLRDLGDVSDEDVRTLERALEAMDQELRLKVFDEKRGDADFEALIAGMETQLKKMTILADFDGEVDGVTTWPGAMVDAGQSLATVFSNDRVVTVKISEENFGRVRLGQPARLRLLTYGSQEFDATVSKLLTVADEAQRFTIYLDVKVDPQQLKPLSTGEATVTVDQQPGQVMIQRRALFDGNKVFVVKDGRVEKREVEVGYVALNVAQIRKGVAVGEPVILDNLESFRDGQRVHVQVAP